MALQIELVQNELLLGLMVLTLLVRSTTIASADSTTENTAEGTCSGTSSSTMGFSTKDLDIIGLVSTDLTIVASACCTSACIGSNACLSGATVLISAGSDDVNPEASLRALLSLAHTGSGSSTLRALLST